MSFEAWCAVAGALLLGVALTRNLLKDWPLSTAITYLGLEILLGPLVLNQLHFEPFKHTLLLERVTEVAVIVSLFSEGLKLRLPFEDGRWKGPLPARREPPLDLATNPCLYSADKSGRNRPLHSHRPDTFS